MNAIPTENSAPSAKSRPSPRGYWSGFSVALFIVVLSVFTWVVQRRVAQYESIQQAGGHHMTATKVCLTDRNQSAAPSALGADNPGSGWILLSSAMFFVVFGSASSHPSKSGMEAFPVLALDACRSHVARMKRNLTHFFFLPPPPFFPAS